MSLTRIRALIADATHLLSEADQADGAAARRMRSQAKQVLTRANELAKTTQPEIRHPNHAGVGVVLGVFPDGRLCCTFANPAAWQVGVSASEASGVES